MRGLRDMAGLWALWWRMLVLTPIAAIMGVAGTVLLLLVLMITFFAPLVVIVLLIGEDYWWAVATAVVWVTWLRFGGGVRRWVFEGFEDGGL